MKTVLIYLLIGLSIGALFGLFYYQNKKINILENRVELLENRVELQRSAILDIANFLEAYYKKK